LENKKRSRRIVAFGPMVVKAQPQMKLSICAAGAVSFDVCVMSTCRVNTAAAARVIVPV
jgi:hypothetical protein